MSQSSKEAWANFKSYVTFFTFAALVTVVGYFAYQFKQQHQKSPVVKTPGIEASESEESAKESTGQDRKPSEWLAPVMSSQLPLLLEDFSTSPVQLTGEFMNVEGTAKRAKVQPGPLQPAWGFAYQICQEMRALQTERNAAATSLTNQQLGNGPTSKIKPSKTQIAENASKKEFFQRSAAQHWTSVANMHKTKITFLYRQLLAAETRANR
jgi:hypothetical protein